MKLSVVAQEYFALDTKYRRLRRADLLTEDQEDVLLVKLDALWRQMTHDERTKLPRAK